MTDHLRRTKKYILALDRALRNDGSVDPECQEKGCPEGCGGSQVPGIGCGGCCDCLGGCRIAYYRQQEAREQETP